MAHLSFDDVVLKMRIWKLRGVFLDAKGRESIRQLLTDDNERASSKPKC